MPRPKKIPAPNISAILAEKGLDRNTEFWQKKLGDITPENVEKALAEPPGCYSFEKLLALISPAAEKYLEEMAQSAHQLSIQRFGRTIKLYGPLYLSNYCSNSCLYCGFNVTNKFKRTRLTVEQALAEADVIAAEGFTDILLVSSEDKKFINTTYLAELASKLRNKFSFISIEIYQMARDEYAALFNAGIEGVTLYQETYNRRIYSDYHRLGTKSDYDARLASTEHIAAAGMREIGLGALLGLADWRIETLALAEHAHYLIKRYWQSHISFSFPRLRPAHEVEAAQFEHLLSDKNLVQMITALRLCFADAGMSLSTRERAELRNNLIKLGITKMSAGSKTNPGGYTSRDETTEQFKIDDDRTPKQIADMITQEGFEPVWKDWDSAFIKG